MPADRTARSARADVGSCAVRLTGGLLNSEKHAQRDGFWAAHVLRPRGAQSQGVAPERRLFPIQQTTDRKYFEIRRAGVGMAVILTSGVTIVEAADAFTTNDPCVRPRR